MICPNCGCRCCDDEFAADLPRGGLSPSERRVLDRLIRAKGGAVEPGALVDALYSHDPNGGPDDGFGSLRIFVYRVRRKIEGRGYTVVSLGKGNGYRLERMAGGE